MADLSPAAQAVLDATYNTYNPADSVALRRCVAAALNAAVLQALPKVTTGEDRAPFSPILAIAAELEGAGAE